ncbi:isoprenoid biosynthesis glyoxalase ElbB [Prosthecochloris sp. N3]|uniref:Isoprenoid biosynthesis glyoxalase ElbB n=1 Tax=Prosthecochloris ethylica TaxID=2743976 RepID=A0ABR9XQ97_9CHLB|nr:MULTISPECIES: isoprenoid biosynthesis glyoxalase ElbB [Prosthecochloris]MEC9485908.1 isoprenoid biosynthesis glyoxalase ElbB [Prosthecochloris sp.]MBF0586531.1 isoprenoid biosynthesis glyoxalase ElbB [Prosthecochloris ethylica]MBF0636144.1 isoprenoid biosynthesis glyoxalase ElbB [Prosthecochloris ethylica]NUK47719.1 isoprenoid biosynthesis glyoxalase ElbB [Prosthecochloris ethylica]RNA64382.1 isoprenoid biosynthesis protein ElbB [Prosthecochloris sp. ZM_2]
MKKIGVLLSGCGVMDGSEIHEAVLTLLAIDVAGAQAVCLAPDIDQRHVINHVTGKEMEGETRNVLVESARICRGEIHDLAEIGTLDLDALVLPGGYGAAKNLSDYAFRGAEFEVLPAVAEAVRSFYDAGKPLGFICISPVIAARVLGREDVELTIGNDKATAGVIESTGAAHANCKVANICASKEGKVISTPAYMLGPSIRHVAQGIEKLVNAVIARA